MSSVILAWLSDSAPLSSSFPPLSNSHSFASQRCVSLHSQCCHNLAPCIVFLLYSWLWSFFLRSSVLYSHCVPKVAIDVRTLTVPTHCMSTWLDCRLRVTTWAAYPSTTAVSWCRMCARCCRSFQSRCSKFSQRSSKFRFTQHPFAVSHGLTSHTSRECERGFPLLFLRPSRWRRCPPAWTRTSSRILRNSTNVLRCVLLQACTCWFSHLIRRCHSILSGCIN